MKMFSIDRLGFRNIGITRSCKADAADIPAHIKFPDKVIADTIKLMFPEQYEAAVSALYTQQKTGKSIKQQVLDVQQQAGAMTKNQGDGGLRAEIAQKRAQLTNYFEEHRAGKVRA